MNFEKICYNCDEKFTSTVRNKQYCTKCFKMRRKIRNRLYYLKRKALKNGKNIITM